MPRLLRLFAIAIAIIAVLDPAIPWTRRARPQVALVTADSLADAALARRVAERLDAEFTIVRGPLSSAAATVLVGARVPAASDVLAAPVFAVLPERDGPAVALFAVRTPARTPLQASLPVVATVRVSGARGRSLDVALRHGALAVDRATRTIEGDVVELDVPLSFVPTSPGAAALRVIATVDGAEQAAVADVVTDVHESRWSVLFFDPRPSWMSTFVRRAIERDPRFIVTSRVVTSRGISTDAGRPPSLDDAESARRFDVIIAGAPDALQARDVAALEAYMRSYGGSVVLLFDREASGPFDRLTNVRPWLAASTDTAVHVERVLGDDGGLLRAREILWPDRLPAGARAVATSRTAAPGSAALRPVVWQSAIGAGRLLVSGALDAWRFRAVATSSFDAFWLTTLAEAAAATPPPIDVAVASPILEPGEMTPVIVTLREPSLADLSSGAPVRAGVSATIESPPGPVPVRLWPDGHVGRFRGTLPAPNEPGSYRVVVSSGDVRTSAPIIVAPDVHLAVRDAPDLVAAWAGASGGFAIPASRLETLPAALADALEPERRRELWYSMRSAWWIIPFALALGAEWWWRRRRGLA
jgi:hypothetical protein